MEAYKHNQHTFCTKCCQRSSIRNDKYYKRWQGSNSENTEPASQGHPQGGPERAEAAEAEAEAHKGGGEGKEREGKPGPTEAAKAPPMPTWRMSMLEGMTPPWTPTTACCTCV